MEIKKMNLLAAVLVCMASCSDDEQAGMNAPAVEGETALFKIEAHAEMGNYSPATSRGITAPAIVPNNFRILAFKESPETGLFLYEQDVPKGSLTYANNVLSGTARLPIGIYKFVPTYGFATGSGFALPEFVPRNTELTENLNITHNTVDGNSVFFLSKDPVETQEPYTLGLNSTAPNGVVSLSMGRAVSRVDILFLQVKEENGVKVEVSDSADVFGASELGSIELQFTGLNKNINLSGNKVTNDDASLFASNYVIADLANAVTKGTSDADTQVGTDGYISYDNIEGAHIKKGSAHVHGAYVLPFSGENDTRLTLVLKNKRDDKRTITIDKPLPLERNKVTLVRVYVLSGTVFSTDVQFQVTVDTAWLGANTVDGEIN